MSDQVENISFFFFCLHGTRTLKETIGRYAPGPLVKVTASRCKALQIVWLLKKKVRRKYPQSPDDAPLQFALWRSCERHQQCKRAQSINLIFCNVSSSCNAVMEKAGMSGILLSDGAPLEADAIWGCTDLLMEKIPDATARAFVCVCVCVSSCASYTITTLILCDFADVTFRWDAMDLPEGMRAFNTGEEEWVRSENHSQTEISMKSELCLSVWLSLCSLSPSLDDKDRCVARLLRLFDVVVKRKH